VSNESATRNRQRSDEPSRKNRAGTVRFRDDCVRLRSRPVQTRVR